MANTENPRYSLKQYDALPAWLKRSWNMFERISIRVDFQKDLGATREAIAVGDANQPEQVIRLIRDYRLGQGMDGAIKELLGNPVASQDDLLNLLPPPMRFINYGLGKMLPSANPDDEFKRNEHLRELLLERAA